MMQQWLFPMLLNPLEQFNGKKDDGAKAKTDQQIAQAEWGGGESLVKERDIDHSQLQHKRQQYGTQHGFVWKQANLPQRISIWASSQSISHLSQFLYTLICITYAVTEHSL